MEELHLLHLHTILVSQTLGVMSSEELQSSAAPVCRHDMAPYVAKVPWDGGIGDGKGSGA